MFLFAALGMLTGSDHSSKTFSMVQYVVAWLKTQKLPRSQQRKKNILA